MAGSTQIVDIQLADRSHFPERSRKNWHAEIICSYIILLLLPFYPQQVGGEAGTEPRKLDSTTPLNRWGDDAKTLLSLAISEEGKDKKALVIYEDWSFLDVKSEDLSSATIEDQMQSEQISPSQY